MFDILLSVGGCYVVVGATAYCIGHPIVARRYETISGKAQMQRSSARQGIVARQVAHAIQTVNFFVHAVAGPKPEKYCHTLSTLYGGAVTRAFDTRKHLFITTGSPHARAYYPRNFAWFYPTLLDVSSMNGAEDMAHRISLMEQSLRTVIASGRNAPYTTTLVAFSPGRFAAVNYVTPPSDSLLGVFCGIEQLLGRSTPSSPPIKDAVLAGQAILANHRTDLAAQVRHLLNQLSSATFETVQGTVTCPLFDAQKNKSTATDTRRERMRFVVNANIWSTLAKAIELDVVAPREIEKSLGCDMATYKEHILDLFGSEGFIRNSVDPDYPAAGIHAITLDFAHINRGFWDFSSSREISLFKNTSAMIMNSDPFKDISRECFFVSAKNAPAGLIHRMTVPSYHGRTVWPALNVEFVDRLLDLSRATGDDDYFAQAAMTLRQIRHYVEAAGGYPELLDPQGKLYRTWIYRSAIADSWFPRFASVWSKAFGTTLG